MKRKRKFIGAIALLLIIAVLYLGWMLLGPAVNEPEMKYFYIRTGDKYENVKANLEKNNILTGTFWFNRIAAFLDYDKAIKPGRYKIKDGMSLLNLVRMLRSGNQSPVNLVITKLRTKEDLARKLDNNFECDSTEVISFLNNNDSLSKYNLDSNTAMTAIIPNTYTLTWNNTTSKIFRKLFNEKEKFWTKKKESTGSSSCPFRKRNLYPCVNSGRRNQ